MEKKYQVFVSSTYEDLKEERQEVMHALLELDCIPSGMELFPAADEDQWSLIKGVIDECDYYLLILGGRYGSLGPDGVGYTEKEYRYALEKGKPIISFLHKKPDDLPQRKTEKSEKGQNQFKEFRKLAQEKMCKYWETPAELGSVVSRSLINLQRKHPGVGWVRGNLGLDKEASIEILELRKQIEGLKGQLEKARTVAPPGTEKLAQGDDKFIVKYQFSTTYGIKTGSWMRQKSLSWNEIYYHISPLMINEATDVEIKKALGNVILTRINIVKLTIELESEGNMNPRDFRLADDSFQTIIVQLRALGLIVKSDKARSVKDTKTYWTLTPYGDSVMNRLRAIKRE